MDAHGLPWVGGRDEGDILSLAPGTPAMVASTAGGGSSAASAPQGWEVGQNVPAVSRAHRSANSDGLVSPALRQVMCNLHHNLRSTVHRKTALQQVGALRQDEVEVATILAALLDIQRTSHCSRTDSVVAALLGLNPRTVANTVHVVQTEGSCPGRKNRGRPRTRRLNDTFKEFH